jgi:4-hydroxy-3-methylbut-2-enyl diphosphate reductase IspH
MTQTTAKQNDTGDLLGGFKNHIAALHTQVQQQFCLVIQERFYF